MHILVNIFAFLLTLFILIIVHEYGHFWVARRLGIKVVRFSIGFGKALWRHQGKSGTEFVIAILPFGGYVKMLDETEGKVAEHEKHMAFNRQSVWKRIAVVLAGPVTNVLLAIVAFWIVFSIGIKQVKPVIGQVKPDSIAAKAGLKRGSEIITIDGRVMRSWQTVMIAVVSRFGDKGKMRVMAKPESSTSVNSHSLNLANWKISGLDPRPLTSLGITPYRPPMPAKIAKVKKGSPAAQAGLQKGDLVVAVNGQKVKHWRQLVDFVRARPGQTAKLTIQRNAQQLTLAVKIGTKRGPGWKKQGYLGVQSLSVKMPPNMERERRYPPWFALWPALQQSWVYMHFNFVILGKMLVGKIPLRMLGGPITIYRTADMAFKQGFVVFVSFLAIISLMLAFINILPIPALDGGHLLFYLIELIFRRPVPVAVQMLLLRLGIILLLVLMAQATINDLMRLF